MVDANWTLAHLGKIVNEKAFAFLATHDRTARQREQLVEMSRADARLNALCAQIAPQQLGAAGVSSVQPKATSQTTDDVSLQRK